MLLLYVMYWLVMIYYGYLKISELSSRQVGGRLGRLFDKISSRMVGGGCISRTQNTEARQMQSQQKEGQQQSLISLKTGGLID